METGGFAPWRNAAIQNVGITRNPECSRPYSGASARRIRARVRSYLAKSAHMCSKTDSKWVSRLCIQAVDVSRFLSGPLITQIIASN